MSDKSSLLSSDNIGTVVAVCFVIALLSLALNFYLYTQLNNVTVGVGNFEVAAAARDKTLRNEIGKIGVMEQRVAELEATVAELAAPPPEPEEEVVDPAVP